MVNPQKTTMDNLTGAFYVGFLDGLLGGAWIIDSDEMDHSRKFPAFFTHQYPLVI